MSRTLDIYGTSLGAVPEWFDCLIIGESLREINVGINLYILVKTRTAVDVNDTTDQKGMNQSGSRKKHNS